MRLAPAFQRVVSEGCRPTRKRGVSRWGPSTITRTRCTRPAYSMTVENVLGSKSGGRPGPVPGALRRQRQAGPAHAKVSPPPGRPPPGWPGSHDHRQGRPAGDGSKQSLRACPQVSGLPKWRKKSMIANLLSASRRS
jgi:hypothetical protein